MYISVLIRVYLKWELSSINSLNIYRQDAPDVLRPYIDLTRIITVPWWSPHSSPSLKQIFFLYGALIYALPMSHSITSKSFSAVINNSIRTLSLGTTLDYVRATAHQRKYEKVRYMTCMGIRRLHVTSYSTWIWISLGRPYLWPMIVILMLQLP